MLETYSSLYDRLSVEWKSFVLKLYPINGNNKEQVRKNFKRFIGKNSLGKVVRGLHAEWKGIITSTYIYIYVYIIIKVIIIIQFIL